MSLEKAWVGLYSVRGGTRVICYQDKHMSGIHIHTSVAALFNLRAHFSNLYKCKISLSFQKNPSSTWDAKLCPFPFTTSVKLGFQTSTGSHSTHTPLIASWKHEHEKAMSAHL